MAMKGKIIATCSIHVLFFWPSLNIELLVDLKGFEKQTALTVCHKLLFLWLQLNSRSITMENNILDLEHWNIMNIVITTSCHGHHTLVDSRSAVQSTTKVFK